MNPHFASLVLGLTAQAKSSLEGKLPPGADAAGANDPKQLAKALIDTLVMLEEMTAGNRGPEETELLNRALTALRFQYSTGQVH